MNEKAVHAMREFLEALGLDLKALGMERTPERVAEMYGLLFSGIGKDTRELWGETFDAGTGADGIVAVKGIPFYSMCEHHLVPFFGEAGIAYLPAKHGVAGFSKFTRLVEVISRKPQLQERMTTQIAEAVARDLHAEGVLVVVEARQLCMMMRGDAAHGARTTTNAVLGRLKEDAGLREQAMALLLDRKK
ncbi:MAG: GTP cyclohydrolase I [Selenomonadaceae bacterium]|nr:GTP cyclohydrolase I [Selenomonadaceae bacterium]